MKIKSLLKAILICVIFLIATSFQASKSLKGVWVYQGGIYNRQHVTATKGLIMERTYSENQYEAFISNPGGKKTKYEAGNYSINGNTYLETQTYCNHLSPLKDKTVHYSFSIKNNQITYKGKLPDGTSVVVYWKKIQ